jgi:hypothetical protein
MHRETENWTRIIHKAGSWKATFIRDCPPWVKRHPTHFLICSLTDVARRGASPLHNNYPTLS